MATINNYIKSAKKAATLQLVQAHVDRELLLKVMNQKKQDGVSWRALIDACLRKYLEECKQ
jgi:hypothetical protein